MNNLFPSLSPTVLALGLAIVTGGVLLVLGGLALNHPLLWRMGLRNTIRRPGQALLLLAGLVLSTMVITASFGLQDSYTHSEMNQRLAEMGTVDETVTGTFTQANVDAALTHLHQLPGVQIALGIIFHHGITVTSAQSGLSIPDTLLYAVPADFGQVYGPALDTRGAPISFATLPSNEVVLSSTLAQNLGVQAGASVQVALDEKHTVTATVRAVLSHDLVVTSGELGLTSDIILPLSRYRQLVPGEPPDTLCIKNAGAGGLDDIGPGGSRSQTVVHALEQWFHAPTTLQGSPTDFTSTLIFPLKPDLVEDLGSLTLDKSVYLSAVGQQFYWLPPIFTCLLVGTGMLLLVLLLILLATERKPELGMSRAIGMQRFHLIHLFLVEGCGYSVVAALLGVALGYGATSGELLLLNHLPQLSPGSVGNAAPVSIVGTTLQPWLSWQSLLSSWCLGVLTVLVTVLLTALWVSRLNIVTALRNLDDPPPARRPLHTLFQTMVSRGVTVQGQPATRHGTRIISALGALLWEVFVRGPLCLLMGAASFVQSQAQQQSWLQLLGVAFLVAGCGLLLNWLLPFVKIPDAVARRLGLSLMGIGWCVSGLWLNNVFLSLFQPVSGLPQAPSVADILLSALLPVLGAVVVIMTNADLLVNLGTPLLRRIRGLAPISRTSLAYPLTFRFRTGVTILLLGLITFLVLLVITTNVGAVEVAQAGTTAGGFQLETDLFSGQLTAVGTRLPALQEHRALGQDFRDVALLRLLYGLEAGAQMRLDLAGHPSFSTPWAGTPLVADETFLSTTTIPMYVRAQGYDSDRQVWDAVKNHPGYAVLRYDPHMAALPASSGFSPFAVEISDGAGHTHRVTVIGLMPASAQWQTLFISTQTAARFAGGAYAGIIFSLFRLQPAVTEAQAAHDLKSYLDASSTNITVQSLDQATTNGITIMLTLFLSGYLALGLLFGALSIGVIAGRAVVERRQQIGMLRALGFSRTLVWRSFLLESSFVIVLSLLIGSGLSFWLSSQIAQTLYQELPLPVGPFLLVVLGSFVIALISTVLPARQAARLHPAEALRYE